MSSLAVVRLMISSQSLRGSGAHGPAKYGSRAVLWGASAVVQLTIRLSGLACGYNPAGSFART